MVWSYIEEYFFRKNINSLKNARQSLEKYLSANKDQIYMKSFGNIKQTIIEPSITNKCKQKRPINITLESKSKAITGVYKTN